MSKQIASWTFNVIAAVSWLWSRSMANQRNPRFPLRHPVSLKRSRFERVVSEFGPKRLEHRCIADPFLVADSPWCLTAAVDSVISSCRLLGLPCASVPAAYPTSHQVEVWQERDSMSTHQHARIMSKSHFHAQCCGCVTLTLEIVFPVMKVEVVDWWFLFHFSGVCWVFALSSSLHMGQALVLVNEVPGLVTRITLLGTRPWGIGWPTRRHVPARPYQFAWQSSEL
ncbi:hypothetical protein GE21DRAFT_1309740 [Neurospora crassa]|nr:hypothetical protein GE21DRAFT_1309740 [Neurospora crassa]